MSDKFIKLTNSEDETTVVLNTKYIVKATKGEDDEVTTIVMSHDLSDEEVNESPEKIYSLINRVDKSPGQSLDANPETPPRATTTALQNGDTHMQNLAKHA